jgi:hypothetical protein
MIQPSLGSEQTLLSQHTQKAKQGIKKAQEKVKPSSDRGKQHLKKAARKVLH